jgi:hypothetical protein
MMLLSNHEQLYNRAVKTKHRGIRNFPAFTTFSTDLDKIKYRLYHKNILNDSEFRGNRQ